MGIHADLGYVYPVDNDYDRVLDSNVDESMCDNEPHQIY